MGEYAQEPHVLKWAVFWRESLFFGKPEGNIWVWVRMTPPGIGPLVLVMGFIYQGKPFWVPIFDPQPDQVVWPEVELATGGK